MDDDLRKLAAEWNEIDGQVGANREAARSLRDRKVEIEDKLGPLLLEWAEANGCGNYRDGSGRLGLVGWYAEDGGYREIRDHTGLRAHGSRIKPLLNRAGSRRHEKARRQAAHEAQRTTA